LKFWLFFEHPWLFFGNKQVRKIWLLLACFHKPRLSSGKTLAKKIGLALAKHWLSCIFITNLLRRRSIAMQGAQNIAKILLLP